MSVSALPPIYGLDATSWSDVVSFLGPGDVIRLCSANYHLSSTLKSAIRDLSLDWVSPRYIDFDKVLPVVCSFTRIASLTFYQEMSTIRCWTPVNWRLLPSSLTFLSMSFLGAPCQILSSGLVGSILPSLAHLILKEELIYDEGKTTTLPPTCTFDSLPPGLITLHVESHRPLSIVPAELANLPRFLESLELLFPPVFTDDKTNFVALRSGLLAPLPILPSGLKRLLLLDDRSSFWLVRCANLPTSIETLQVKANVWIPHILPSNEPSPSGGSCIDLTGASTRLMNLTRFQIAGVQLTPEQATALLPPSVTEIDARVSLTPSTPDNIIQHIGPKLVKLSGFGSAGGETIIGVLSKFSQTHFSRLIKLELSHKANISISVPDSVTDLQVSFLSSLKELPLSVVELKGMPNSFDSLRPSLWTPNHRIVSLSLFGTENFEDVSQLRDLPSTIRKLDGNFSDKAFCSLLQLVSEAPSLANLIQLRNFISLKEGSISHIPRQLRKLMIKFKATPSSFDRLLADTIASSELDELDMTLYPFSGSSEKDEDDLSEAEMEETETLVFQLLNRLPKTLKRFFFVSPVRPSYRWPVKLPYGLRDLDLARLFTVEEPKVSNRLRDSQSLLELPDSLTRITLHNVDPFLLEHLPAYLSHYILPYRNDGQEGVLSATYLDSRSDGLRKLQM